MKTDKEIELICDDCGVSDCNCFKYGLKQGRQQTAQEILTAFEKHEFYDFEGECVVGKDARFRTLIKELKNKYLKGEVRK
jgi:hypothetical protein